MIGNIKLLYLIFSEEVYRSQVLNYNIRWSNFGGLSRILLTCLTVVIFLHNYQVVAVAQTENANILNRKLSDPLLPPGFGKRPLTTFEKNRIKREIIELNNRALAELANGNIDGAFVFWYRELRLQSALGRLSEVTALGRIGAIAWQQNRGVNLRAIAQRLITIQQQAENKEKLNYTLLNRLGIAYRQVRYLDRATDIYRQLLTKTRNQNNLNDVYKNLVILGNLHLARFNYIDAAPIYEELLALLPNIANNSQKTEKLFLEKLVSIYQETNELNKAIAIKKRLLANAYFERSAEIATMKISIAEDCQALKQSELAIEYYQQAIDLATSQQQMAIATDALTKLAALYQNTNQTELALQTYQQLIAVQQQTYDYYGWMNTCDRLGNIYLKLQNYQQAQAYFKQGLKLAQSLNYQSDHFQNKLDKIDTFVN